HIETRSRGTWEGAHAKLTDAVREYGMRHGTMDHAARNAQGDRDVAQRFGRPRHKSVGPGCHTYDPKRVGSGRRFGRISTNLAASRESAFFDRRRRIEARLS